MPSELINLLLGGLIGFLASILTTITTHWLQVKRDDKERQWKSKQEITSRWWERKATAYGNIITSLVSLTNSLGNWFDLEVQINQLDGQDMENEVENIIEEYKDSLRSIEKAEIEGAYLITDKATLTLNQLVKELKKEDEYTQFFALLSDRYSAARSCIQIITDEARKDLKVVTAFD